MTVYLKGEIEPELIDKLSEAINKLPNDNTLVIYLDTFGGSIDIQEAILDILELNKDKVELVGSGNLFSAGFNIFFRAKCKRRLLENTWGMAHFIWTTVEMDQAGKAKTDYDKFQVKELKKSKQAYIEFFKELGLTNAEINNIKKGNEHYLTYDRMKELLNIQNGKNEEK